MYKNKCLTVGTVFFIPPPTKNGFVGAKTLNMHSTLEIKRKTHPGDKVSKPTICISTVL